MWSQYKVSISKIMICIKCWNTISDDSTVCPFCGRKITPEQKNVQKSQKLVASPSDLGVKTGQTKLPPKLEQINWPYKKKFGSNQKFIFIFVVVIIAIVGVGFFVIRHQVNQKVQELADQNKKLTEESQKQNLSLKQQISELQAQQAKQASRPTISSSLSSTDINKIIGSVVVVYCGSNANATSFNQGSGTVWKFSDTGGYYVFTNAHVITTTDGSAPICAVEFPILPSGVPTYIFDTTLYSSGYTNGADWAILQIGSPYQNQYDLSQTPLFSDYDKCNASDISIGDAVTIFGYPAVGGTNITVTQGYITGFDGNDFKVSSGIIDHGNSGGGAILDKSRCSLGIPTWVNVGAASTVGVVQSWKTIYGN